MPRPRTLDGWQPFQRLRDRIARLRGSPHEIALGLAIGMVVTFTPTIGFQTLLVLGIATLLGASRPAAIVPTWLTSPITIPPIFGFTWYLGSFFWPGSAAGAAAVGVREAARRLAALEFLAFREQLDVFLDLGMDVFVPLWIGGLIVGAISAVVTYPITLRMVVRLRERRRRRADSSTPPARPEAPSPPCA